ncbi:hypothetical protein BCR39DRAFT_547545 [Naematelia encephala]|uniref:Uncharacterized protein n=1 Tax=Naematelia encephala TaxID=71784 RepID=A0A1Y2AP12_9TREE|nr:hypothetical protein BCR39DRAFT_547545 [Naematelia encephala]
MSNNKPLKQWKADARVKIKPSHVPTSKRARQSSSSSSDSEDVEDDRAAMLAALNAHSRTLLGIATEDSAESSEQGRRRMASLSGSEDEEVDDDDESGDEYQSDDGWGAEDGFVTDSEDEGMKEQETSKQKASVPEVVFAPVSGTVSSALSKSERRAFLNGNTSKMMGIKVEQEYGPRAPKRAREVDEVDAEDQSNMKLDKTLHDMLLTTLLPTAAADTVRRPVDKRNALHGRILELSEITLPGQGSSSAKSSGLSSHPAKIRTGIVHAKAKKQEKARAEAEAAGSWVKGKGGLGDGGKRGVEGSSKRKRLGLGQEVDAGKRGMDARNKGERSRGLAMGIGRFEGGMLKLSERDIARGNAEPRGGFKGKRGRGGRGGGRGGKRRS